MTVPKMSCLKISTMWKKLTLPIRFSVEIICDLQINLSSNIQSKNVQRLVRNWLAKIKV